MNDVFTYELPGDIHVSNQMIGEYDRETGCNPHDLLAFDFDHKWRAPSVKFGVDADQIDAAPYTNLPVQLFHRRICDQILALAPGDVVAIDTPVIANGTRIDNFAILHPLYSVAVWNLDRSDWSGLAMESWPEDRPMYMRNMVMADNIDTFTIAYNEHWASMLVFDDRVASIIRNESTWARITTPDAFSNG